VCAAPAKGLCDLFQAEAESENVMKNLMRAVVALNIVWGTIRGFAEALGRLFA
jgi:hypothetical protein